MRLNANSMAALNFQCHAAEKKLRVHKRVHNASTPIGGVSADRVLSKYVTSGDGSCSRTSFMNDPPSLGISMNLKHDSWYRDVFNQCVMSNSQPSTPISLGIMWLYVFRPMFLDVTSMDHNSQLRAAEVCSQPRS